MSVTEVTLNNLTNDSGALEISWERTLVSVPFTVPTQEIAMNSIEKALAGPTVGDYFSAAKYYYESDKELNKALLWINNAISLTPSDKDVPFWYLRLKSLIQAKLGDKKGAIQTAKYSLEGAVKAGNKDYEKMVMESIRALIRRMCIYWSSNARCTYNILRTFSSMGILQIIS